MTPATKWRIAFATAGTAAFMLLYSQPWDDPVMIVYDLAAAPLVFCFVGGVAFDLLRDRAARTLIVRVLMLAPITVVPVLRALGVADISGHLTCALAIGIYEACARGNSTAARVWAALVPVVVLAIRLHWQGLPVEVDTVAGLVVGAAVGVVGAVWVRSLKHGDDA